jgi:MYXO-CTERM domain-containing protein
MGPRSSGVVLVVGLLLALSALAVPALAQGSDLDELEAELAASSEEAASADCSVACKALESMIRSADRICDLEPGARCDAARKKVDEAKRRVREACPDCAAATAGGDGETRPHPAAPSLKPGVQPEDQDHGQDGGGEAKEKVQQDAAPASGSVEVRKRSGCGACTTAPGAPNLTLPAWCLLIAAAVLRRRRRD